MIKTFYIQKNEESVITDIIEFPHEDYVEVQINTPLPPKIMSGCYKLLNGELIYIPNLDEDKLLNKISILMDCQKAILRGDMQTLAYNNYPEDFEDIKVTNQDIATLEER